MEHHNTAVENSEINHGCVNEKALKMKYLFYIEFSQWLGQGGNSRVGGGGGGIGYVQDISFHVFIFPIRILTVFWPEVYGSTRTLYLQKK